MDRNKEILELVDYINISEDDFIDIPVNLNDIDKKRVEKAVKRKALKINNLRRVTIACSFMAILLVSALFISKPVFADGDKLIEKIYKALGFYDEYKEYSEYIGETKELDGYKITIENIVATEKKYAVVGKIISEEPFDTTQKPNNIHLSVSLLGADDESGSGTFRYIDEHTVMFLEERGTNSKYPKRGDLVVNVWTNSILNEVEKDNLNIQFKFKVDLSKGFHKSKSIDISRNIKVGDREASLDSMYISPIETIMSGRNINREDRFILALDNELYAPISGHGKNEQQQLIYGAAISEINKAKTISIIPMRVKMNLDSDEARAALNKMNYEETLKSAIMKEEFDVKYPKSYKSLDGTDGEIYKIERTEDTLKIFIWSSSNSLIKATSVKVRGGLFNSNESAKIYKDQSRDNGWIKEFKLDKDCKYLEIILFAENPQLYELGEPVEIYSK
jgi:hypothetical protein